MSPNACESPQACVTYEVQFFSRYRRIHDMALTSLQAVATVRMLSSFPNLAAKVPRDWESILCACSRMS